jgi:hypothetical protein
MSSRPEHITEEWYDVTHRDGRFEVQMKVTGEYRHRRRDEEQWRPGRPDGDHPVRHQDPDRSA